ncbi:MAG: DUF799 family lipoprotein [Deltaproteobacteria bacterium]|nr:MAG: DUF799 family lipoprotein [Deltaproteobacteria bacterium]
MTRWGNYINARIYIPLLTLVSLVACVTSSIPDNYHDPGMDFAALRTIAVMPFGNLTGDKQAGERVRDTFMTALLSSGAVYVVPAGEVARGISKVGVINPTAPSEEEIVKLAIIIKADALITGVIREYGQVRSGTTSANVISLSLQMIEKESKKVVWTASSTKGGISIWDRLFGGGGRPMNEITEAAIDDIINKLFY